MPLVWIGVDHLSGGSREREALIVLSDGGDNASRVTRDEAVRKAQGSHAVIYSAQSGSGNVRSDMVIPDVRRWVARLLIACGAAVLLWVAADLVLTASYRRDHEATLESMRRSPATDEGRRAPTSLAIGEPIGTLEIARVGLSGVVVEGDDDSVLDRAIGHLPDTPLPWLRGNSALAAHRDALFRPLKDVRLGDILRLRTPHGDFDYLVRETLIVKPDALWVLDPTPVSMLTLISCFPFNFIGAAPDRFIVRAERIPTG